MNKRLVQIEDEKRLGHPTTSRVLGYLPLIVGDLSAFCDFLRALGIHHAVRKLVVHVRSHFTFDLVHRLHAFFHRVFVILLLDHLGDVLAYGFGGGLGSSTASVEDRSGRKQESSKVHTRENT